MLINLGSCPEEWQPRTVRDGRSPNGNCVPCSLDEHGRLIRTKFISPPLVRAIDCDAVMNYYIVCNGWEMQPIALYTNMYKYPVHNCQPGKAYG